MRVDADYRVLDNEGKPIAGLYAIGDLIGGPLLAHKASAEGISCVEGWPACPSASDAASIFRRCRARPSVVPRWASMGLTGKGARGAGRAHRQVPFKVSGKGQATTETDGMVKVVIDDQSGEILGAHILGGSASDMIATLTLARASELTATEILHTVFAHPTFAEVMKDRRRGSLRRSHRSVSAT